VCGCFITSIGDNTGVTHASVSSNISCHSAWLLCLNMSSNLCRICDQLLLSYWRDISSGLNMLSFCHKRYNDEDDDVYYLINKFLSENYLIYFKENSVEFWLQSTDRHELSVLSLVCVVERGSSIEPVGTPWPHFPHILPQSHK